MSDGHESDKIPSRRLDKVKARIDPSDMGRGRQINADRQCDSSSSRESSLHKKTTRSTASVSDEGGGISALPEDADTPPQPEGPLLRPPVAFPEPTRAPVETYEATLPQASTSRPPKLPFLPGQEVPVPPKKTKSPRNKGQKKTTRPRRSGAFSDRTGTFRLQGYVNDPNDPFAQPPTYFGSGPYSSLYRAEMGGNLFSHTESSYVDLNVASGSFTTQILPPNTANASATQLSPFPRAPQNTPNSDAAERQFAPHPQPGFLRQSFSNTAPATDPHNGHRPITEANALSYYRRDYDRNQDLALTAPPTYPTSLARTDAHARRGTLHPRYHSPRPSVTTNPINPNPPNPPNRRLLPESSRGASDTANGKQKTHSGKNKITSEPSLNTVPLRMLTILIEDIRSGTSDHQLAEVKVPLRPANDPANGFWGDAKAISEALQASPSRIDGPAKAYTLRGKYRQFFLRVSADNIDTFGSANLQVDKNRTLSIVVEANPPPSGSLPSPPNILYRPVSTSTSESEMSPSPVKTTPKSSRRRRSPEHYTSARKRRRLSHYDSDSTDKNSSDPHISQRRLRSQGPSASRNVESNNVPSSSFESIAMPSAKKRWPAVLPPEGSLTISSIHSQQLGPPDAHDWPKSGSPKPDASPEEVEASIWKAIQIRISEEEEWVEFMKIKALPPPHKVSQTLRQYRFVQSKVDEWEDRKAPFKSSHHVVNKSHVLSALGMDAKWGSDCTETLKLLALYGPEGERCRDGRVMAMIEDETAPIKGRPAKKLLRLLREIDVDWVSGKDSLRENESVVANADGSSRVVETEQGLSG